MIFYIKSNIGLLLFADIGALTTDYIGNTYFVVRGVPRRNVNIHSCVTVIELITILLGNIKLTELGLGFGSNP